MASGPLPVRRGGSGGGKAGCGRGGVCVAMSATCATQGTQHWPRRRLIRSVNTDGGSCPPVGVLSLCILTLPRPPMKPCLLAAMRSLCLTPTQGWQLQGPTDSSRSATYTGEVAPHLAQLWGVLLGCGICGRGVARRRPLSPQRPLPASPSSPRTPAPPIPLSGHEHYTHQNGAFQACSTGIHQPAWVHGELKLGL